MEIWQQVKLLQFFKCSFGIWKKVGDLKFKNSKIQLFELFNYLIWCGTENVELKLKFSSDIWTSVKLNCFNWFCYKMGIEKLSILHNNLITQTFSNANPVKLFILIPNCGNKQTSFCLMLRNFFLHRWLPEIS